MTIQYVEIYKAASFEENHINKLMSVLGKEKIKSLQEKISFSLTKDLEKIKDNFKKDNLENIILALHSMKGATSSIGLLNLHITIKQLEESLKKDKNIKHLDDFIPWLELVIKEISPS